MEVFYKSRKVRIELLHVMKPNSRGWLSIRSSNASALHVPVVAVAHWNILRELVI
jgi:hypothetical protein